MTFPAPVFIIGCPRSGTTILLDLLAAHEQFAWVSNWANLLPELPLLSAANRVYSLPVVGQRLYLHREQLPLPNTREPWVFWSKHLASFQWLRNGDEPPRRHAPADMGSAERVRIRRAVARVCRYQGRPVFLSKYTDHPRMNYLRHAFPAARFVHIHRDGRAVAASLAAKISAGKFHTWGERHWWAAAWPDAWRSAFARHESPLCLSAFLWKYFLTEIREEALTIPASQFIEIRYKDLVEQPLKSVGQVIDRLGMPRTQRWEWHMEHRRMTNQNRLWRERLSSAEKAVLDEVIHEPWLRDLFDDAEDRTNRVSASA